MRYDLNLRIETPRAAWHVRARKSMQATVVARDTLLTDPMVLLGLLVFIATVGWVGLQDRSLAEETRALSSEVVVAVQDSVAIARDLQAIREYQVEQRRLEDRIEIYRRIDHGRFRWVQLLDEMAMVAPGDLWITSWEEVDRTAEGEIDFRVVGYTSDNDVLGGFLRALQDSPFIAQVNFEETARDVIASENVTRYVLRGRTRAPGPDFIERRPASEPESAAEPDLMSDLPRLDPLPSLPNPGGP